MELNYKLTEEDYINFNVFHAKNSKTVKRALTIQRIAVPVIYLLLALLGSAILELSFFVLLIPTLIINSLWVIFYPAYFYRLIKRNAGKMMKEGKNSGVLGEHTMIFSEEGLREISPKGEMTLSWSGIEILREDHAGFYLYNSGMSAFIVPKKELENSGEVGSFLASKIEH